ncbi:RNA polymerase sigma factor [Patescibacteria group bacterium]|nr:RNA polymerase sigma factor [Patescibacteria group bacterium]
MTKEINDDEIQVLVEKAQDGDKDAFAQIYDVFFDQIFRYVYFRVVPTEVDDIVENIFIKAWMNIVKYEQRDVKFSSWLFRIAHNTVIDFRRAHRSIEPLSPTIADESERSAPKAMTEQVMTSKKVRDAVDKLKEPYKQVVVLKFLSGLSNSEIAEVLGQREGNIRVLQFRALKELKKLLAEKGFSAKNL